MRFFGHPRKHLTDSGAERFIREAVGTSADFLVPQWWDFNFWEPSVQLALRDLCKPDDTVFDVGASAGALSVFMSRLVGLKGEVHAFEASPRVIDKTQFNLNRTGCVNVRLNHKAVYHQSGQRVSIKESGHSPADSIYWGKDTGQFVETVTLDDYSSYWHLEPSLIKMDIEGAEYDALQGALELIRRCKPHLILEQQCGDLRCLDLLKSEGYQALDLSTYRAPVLSMPISNILLIHESRLAATSYANWPDPKIKHELKADELADFDLDAGRYIIETLISSEREDNEVMAWVRVNSLPVMRYHTNMRFLAESYRLFPIHLSRSGRVSVMFEFQNGTSDSTFKNEGARVWRVAELSNSAHSSI